MLGDLEDLSSTDLVPIIDEKDPEFRVYFLAFRGPGNSIPDRIRRGYNLIASLAENNIVQAGDWILIIGTGATGIAAASAARDHGIVSVVVDYRELFALQANCHTRWIHPYQYSWPDPGFGNVSWEWTPETSHQPLLPWSAGRANKIALYWRNWFDNSLYKGTPIIVQDDLEQIATVGSLPHPPDGEPDGLQDILDWLDQSPFSDIKTVVVSKSHKDEKVSLGEFRGFKFWEDDPFERDGFRLPAGVAPQVFISGGGNGGLQDYIRIVTGKQPIEVLARLRETYAQNQAPELDFIAAFEKNMQSSCEQAVCNAVALITESRSAIPGNNDFIKFPFNDPKASLTLAHSGSNFHEAYPLNAWLVMVLSKFIENVYRRPTILLKTTTEGITVGVDSGGQGPWKYHGSDNVAHVLTEGQGPSRIPANIVILRHGVYPFIESPKATKEHANQPIEPAA
jgi:hypothetical protein